jgi:hypothetical protein
MAAGVVVGGALARCAMVSAEVSDARGFDQPLEGGGAVADAAVEVGTRIASKELATLVVVGWVVAET